jgi:hypothetical protein
LPPSLRSPACGATILENSFWRIKARGTDEVPISSHIYDFVEFPRCERRYMTFPLQSPTFLIVAAAVAGLIALGAPGEHVQAQTNAPPAVAPTPRLTLTAEQEYIIREIILKNSNVQKQNTAPETVGDVVPEDVKLYPLPQDVIQKVPQARSHMFFVKDDEVILVSSSDRRVADVIKKKSTD